MFIVDDFLLQNNLDPCREFKKYEYFNINTTQTSTWFNNGIYFLKLKNELNHGLFSTNPILKQIPKESIENIKKYDCKLVLWLAKESRNIYTRYKYTYQSHIRIKENIIQCCTELGIPLKNVYLIVGDLNGEVNGKDIPFNIIGYNYTWLSYMSSMYGMKEYSPIQEKTYFDKLFICLNGTARIPRLWFMEQLYKRGLDKFGYISVLDLFQSSNFINEVSTLQTIYNKDYNLDIIKKIPIVLDKTPEMIDGMPQISDDNGLVEGLHIKSFINVVTETIVNGFYNDPNSNMITEKTYKPIIAGQPFIVFGGANIHKQLEDDGFVSYNELFDYSFSSELDPFIKTELILDNIERLSRLSPVEWSRLYENVKEKINHNRNHFFNPRNVRNNFVKLLGKINAK